METLLILLIFISISFNCTSLKACMIAGLSEASWKEIYKIVVNMGVIIYLYGKIKG